MSNEKENLPAPAAESKMTAKYLFNREEVKSKFQELLGKQAPSFITSVLQIVASNELLKNADPNSIYQAAAVAATLDLPLNNNLGFAYIIPFKDRDKGQVAQFQIGYRGLIQLSQRSGQFKTISATPIYEGQLIEQNPLTGFKFDFARKLSDKIIGYAAYMELLNGFEKTLFMTVDELSKHGLRYSQTMKKGFGLWKDNFEAMAIKTVLKLLLSKFAPLSIEMQKAVLLDQSVVSDNDNNEGKYIDNTHENPVIDKENERVEFMITDCKSIKDLDKLGGEVDMSPSQIEAFNERKTAILVEIEDAKELNKSQK